jgi:hypothetical protein
VTNAIGRSREEFKQRIKTEAALPKAEIAAMGFRALLTPGQILTRKTNSRQDLFEKSFVRRPRTQ